MAQEKTFRFLFPLLLTLGILFMLGSPVEAATPKPGKGFIGYHVQAGDTLWLLSQRYGTSATLLQQINGLAGTNLIKDQFLYLSANFNTQGTIYTVQPGDTLFLISQRSKRPLDAIQELNGITGTEIFPGNALSIPWTRPGYEAYMVEKGDTLTSIAAKYATTAAILKASNGLSTDLLFINQIIEVPLQQDKLPGGEHPEEGDNPPEINQQANDLQVYRVQPGDNLWSISRKFATTIDAIYQTNRLHSETLMPGQPLYIPPGLDSVVVDGPKGIKVAGFGEFLEWDWARWIYNVGARATITDLETGLSFQVFYMGGSNHADSEPLTAKDSEVMLRIFGGKWTWNSRPILLTTSGSTLAASMSGMPHSIESITDNNFNGHFDVYFWNSRSHSTNEIQPDHQANILQAAGR